MTQLQIYAESPYDSQERKWKLSVNGQSFDAVKKSGEILTVPAIVGQPGGKAIITYSVDSPFEYKGNMNIGGKSLSFIVGPSKAFKVVASISPTSAMQGNMGDPVDISNKDAMGSLWPDYSNYYNEEKTHISKTAPGAHQSVGFGDPSKGSATGGQQTSAVIQIPVAPVDISNRTPLGSLWSGYSNYYNQERLKVRSPAPGSLWKNFDSRYAQQKNTISGTVGDKSSAFQGGDYDDNLQTYQPPELGGKGMVCAGLSNGRKGGRYFPSSLQSGSQTESKTTTIWSGKITISSELFIPAYSAKSPLQNTNVSYNATEWELSSATLQVEAVQDYTSGLTPVFGGPNLQSYLNGTSVNTITWGFGDTNSHSSTTDVTSSILNGSNQFQFIYNVPSGVVSASGSNNCTMTATLLMVWNWIGQGPAPSPPSPSGLYFGLTTTQIAAVGAAAVAAIVGVSLAVGARGNRNPERVVYEQPPPAQYYTPYYTPQLQYQR
jgi:hypothetical protein